MVKSLLTWLGLDEQELTVEQEFLLVLSGLTIFAILPFSFYRFVQGQWLIGLVDFLMVFGALSSSIYALKVNKARAMSIIFVVILCIGFVVAVALAGGELIYWSFPVTVASYFILRLREAVICSVLVLVSTLLLTYQSLSFFEALTYSITFILVSLFSFLFSDRSAREKRRLSEQALNDALTGAANRRALDDELEKIASSLATEDADTTEAVILIFDIDYFKQINDQFGHAIGDKFLIKFVEFLKGILRPSEKIYRFGGEEFVVIVRSNLDDAVALAEQLRALLEQTPLIRDHKATMSIGVAEITRMDNVREWMKRADDALYKAKSSGRNQVQVAETPDWKDEVDRLLERN